MRLLKLNDNAPGGLSLTLHPNLTVVSGLHGDARRRVLDALAALPGGSGHDGLDGVSGLIEAHGILFDLDREALALLEMETDLDVVVGRSDLERLDHESPDAAAFPVSEPSRSLAGARIAERDARATHEALRASLDRLRATYDQAVVDRAALASALAEMTTREQAGVARSSTRAGSEVGRTDDVGASRGTTALLETPGPTPEAVNALAAAAARVDRLRTKRDEILATLEPLAEIASGPVRAALLEARRLDCDERIPDPEAERLAGMFAAAAAAVEECDRRLEAAGVGPAAVARRLDEAQLRFVAAEEAVRPPTIDPDDARELEAAHEAMQDAELRVMASRMPGKNSKRRLEETVAAEQEILARMGFATYTAFVMSTTAPSVSPDLKVALERAQVELVQAEAAYAELSATYDRDPERSSLVEDLEDLRRRGHALVGRVDEGDLVRALEGLTVVDEAHAAAAVAAAEVLREALEVVGVDFGDLHLRGDEIADVATVWLADMDDAAEQRAELEAACGEVEADIARVESELADMELSSPTEAFEPVEAPDHAAGETDVATDGVDAAAVSDTERALLEALEIEADLEEQLDAQSALVAAVVAGAMGAADRLAVLEAAEAAAGEDRPTGGEDLSERPGLEQLEWFLLAKLAAQRSVSYAGAVPLVLDDALGHLPDDEVVHLLGRLNLMTDAVQVIYLGDDERVIAWADNLGPSRGHALVLQ